MKHIRFFLALFLALWAAPAAGETQYHTQMPPLLCFTQETVNQPVAQDVYLLTTYPDTACETIDADMRALVDDMAARNLPLLPLEQGSIPSYLDVGAVVSRSGESVLSFLTLAEVSKDTRQLSVDFETRVYDAADGRLLTLDDFFADDSAAWPMLAQAVHEQLSAAFPALEPDAQALEHLCAAENIRKAPFTLGAARLTLTYRADVLYPGKNSLLHVQIPYPQIRAHMTEYGRRQTDNSRFRLIALTYDDGPARAATRNVLNALRRHGAQATFFIVGKNIARNHDNLCRQQDSGYSIQSHSYTHIYPKDQTANQAYEEEERLRSELGNAIGVPPVMMRAPGGTDPFYARKQIGYPLINWTAPSGDSGSDDVRRIYTSLVNRAAPGGIVLMHDARPKCHQYTEAFLENLCSRGYLCVTVEELFIAAGVIMEPNVIYYSPYRIQE